MEYRDDIGTTRTVIYVEILLLPNRKVRDVVVLMILSSNRQPFNKTQD
jgi:hypothetical protein